MFFLFLYIISKQAYSSTRTFFITNFNIFKYFNFSNLQSNYAISKHLTTLGSDLVVLVARYKLIAVMPPSAMWLTSAPAAINISNTASGVDLFDEAQMRGV